jgi:Putative metal-binding motif
MPIACDDGNGCTEDRCDRKSGVCRFDPVTIDADGDGFRRPLPGFAPGTPGACGDDCNDATALASPAGVELCDGIDNDCDGIVDIGSSFAPTEAPALLLSSAARQGGTPGGLTFSDSSGTYGAVFTQRNGSSQNSFTSIRPGQATLGPVVPVTEVNSDTFAGPIVGRDAIFATAWEDRRDEDYEIYFNRLNTRGEKLSADVRVTNAQGFSLRPTLLEVNSARGQEYRLAWEDERDGGGGRIFGQRLNGSGELVQGNIDLTPIGLDPSAPTLVGGQQRMGLLFNQAVLGGRGIGFMSFDFDFGTPTQSVTLNAVSPDAASIVANAGRFVVAWHVVEANSLPGPQIWGSVLSESGEVLVDSRPLTDPVQHARYHSLLPLGDRLLLLWSEWRTDRYEIYSRELSPELDPLGDERLLTGSSPEAYAPLAAFGPRGEIGVMFTGRTAESRQPQVFFTRLSCDSGAQLPGPR